MEARLSIEKIEKLKDDISAFSQKKRCTKRELLSLVGSLGFACKVIVPGRSFLSRIITLSCTVSRLHHRVYINTQVRDDLCVWYKFLSDWIGREFFLSDQMLY